MKRTLVQKRVTGAGDGEGSHGGNIDVNKSRQDKAEKSRGTGIRGTGSTMDEEALRDTISRPAEVRSALF